MDKYGKQALLEYNSEETSGSARTAPNATEISGSTARYIPRLV